MEKEMTSRIGTCSGCGAKYKIPETFTGSRAKCKKCGGVVEIPALEEQAAKVEGPAAAAPAAKPGAARKPAVAPGAGAVKPGGRAAAAPVVRRASRGRAGAARGRAAGARRTSRRGRDEDEESTGVQSWVWIVGGVSLVGIVVILFLLLGGNGDQEPSDLDLASVTDTTAGETAIESVPADVEEPPEESASDLESTEPEPVEDTTPTAAEIPEEPEEVDPVIKLDPLPPIIGCDQELFDRLTHCFTAGFVKEELPRFERAPLLEEFENAEWRLKVPILLNSFNGLDLLKPNDVVLAFRIAEMWNKMTGAGWVDVPIKGDTVDEEMQANLPLNVKNVYAIYNIWKAKIDDVEAQQVFFDKCEGYREKAAAKEAGDG
jgi:hypothetical protein